MLIHFTLTFQFGAVKKHSKIRAGVEKMMLTHSNQKFGTPKSTLTLPFVKGAGKVISCFFFFFCQVVSGQIEDRVKIPNR